MIRAATALDAAALADLDAVAFPHEQWGESVFRAELVAERILLVAVEPELVGYVDVSVAGDVADLVRIAVHPDARRVGLARALVEEAAARSVDAGADRMLLEVAEPNAAARALYAALGFAEIDRRPRYYRDGSDALVLARRLAEEPA